MLRSIVAELNENTQGLTIDAKVAGLKQIGLQYGMKNPNTVLNEWLKYYAGMVKALGDQYWQADLLILLPSLSMVQVLHVKATLGRFFVISSGI